MTGVLDLGLLHTNEVMLSFCAGAPFICGAFLVFIALIIGLCIRQDEVQQSMNSGTLQDPLLGESYFALLCKASCIAFVR
jgi:hypothetical protein